MAHLIRCAAVSTNSFIQNHLAHDVARDIIGYSLPVLSTESGARLGDNQDPRYPGMTPEYHKVVNLQIVEHMKTAPSYHMCEMFWLWGSEIMGSGETGEMPAWRTTESLAQK